MEVNWTECSAVEQSPDKMSGAWVFRGTRIPVKLLFDNLELGANIDDFMEWYPGASKEQIKQVLEFASRGLAAA